MSEYKVIGMSVPRPDARDKVVGGKGYTVNVALPGMLHGRLLRCPYPHARVRGMDTRAAASLPGVKAVLTPADVPAKKFSPIYIKDSTSPSVIPDVRVLDDVARYVGQPVAVVAATTSAIAAQALALIEVDYEVLPAVFDPEQAMCAGAPQLHAAFTDNVCARPVLEQGDLEAGFAAADHVFEHTYRTHRVHTCYMEPWVVVVDADRCGHLTVYCSTQHIFGLRDKLAHILDLPASRITVVKPPYIGGGFGAKTEITSAEPLAALLSMQTGRAVRIENSREEEFVTNARTPMTVHLKTGVTNEGIFTARSIRVVADCGAYATYGPEAIIICGVAGAYTAYRCANRRFEGLAVLTNNMRAGAYRGIGGVQGCFAAESQIDEICTTLGLDPIEFRLRNAHHAGDPNPLTELFDPGRFRIESYGFEACLRRGAERFGWPAQRAAGGGAGIVRRGVGLAAQPIWVSGCVGFPDIPEQSGANIRIHTDGCAIVSGPTVDIGSGQNTTLAQIAAEELGLPFAAVRMSESVSSDNVPFEPPTHASRATYSAGNAVRLAARDAKHKLLQVAAMMLEASPEDLQIADGRVTVAGSHGTSLSVAEIARYTESAYVQLTAAGPLLTRLEAKGSIVGTSSAAPPSNPPPPCAMFVEVEVDTQTGQVRVTRVVYAHDVGRVINPRAAEGQVEGAVQQGIGFTLMEHLQFDPDTGACLTSDFLDYKMPTAVEMPASIESIFVETNEPTGPFGAKGLGEPPLIVPAPAIANAVYDAVGVRIRDLPITPEKILAGLGKL
ncbi:MAG: molybdopterin-dependent oxidoreductase [Gammaproteobacteria bacterium]|nr:molybdopterin-dependent oxidoreductase [Gammaproteobacteria bacterium]